MSLSDEQVKVLRIWLRKRSIRCRETADICTDPLRAAKLEGLSEGFEELYKVLLLGPEFVDELLDKEKEKK